MRAGPSAQIQAPSTQPLGGTVTEVSSPLGGLSLVTHQWTFRLKELLVFIGKTGHMYVSVACVGFSKSVPLSAAYS